MSPSRATLDDLYREEGKAEFIGGRIVQLMASGDLPSDMANEIYVSLRSYAKGKSKGVAKADGIGYAVPELPCCGIYMRELTTEERVRLETLQSRLDAFVQEGMEALVEFVNRLELPEPSMVLRNAGAYSSPLDLFMRNQIIMPEDRVWIITRIGYFVGEFLSQRLGGYWFVDKHPDSAYFLQYVVGEFTSLRSLNARISPFALAAYYVDEPPGRSLAAVLARAEDQLR
jgi:hypothetical protein